MSHLTELAARAFASVGFNSSTVGGEEQARLVALYVQALQTLPAAQHVQAQQSQAQLQAQLQAHARAQAQAQALRSHLGHVAGAGGSPILAAIGSPIPAIPSTPRTPLAPGSLQPTTSEAILTPSAGKENHGGLTEEHAKVHKFVEKDLLQLVELVTDAVSQHGELEKNSPCWKRIGASMKRSADVVYKKWACLKHAANEDKAAMKALNMQVKDKFTAPLGAGFTQAVYEGVLAATGMSKDEAQHPLKVYDDEMDKMQKTWQKHKPKLELPEKPVEPHMPDVPEESPKLDVPGRGAGSSRGKREQEGFDSDGDGEPLGIQKGLDYGLS
ncbi:hypothetical protein V8C86DRAFT_2609834 [Haematococcus lacustris]